MSYSGHEQAAREWRSALSSPRMHHAWLLTGRRGIGKMGFALEAARELVGITSELQTENHPDILVLSHLPSSADEEKKREQGKPYQKRRNITIDQVRAVQQRLVTRPTLGSHRAIIIDPVDDLERNASNALLKSLEEPPAGTFFLLISHNPGRLLPTIRSRCRTLRFSPLGAEQIDSVLRQNAPQADVASRRAAITASSGSVGAALDFVELDLGRIHLLMEEIAREGDRDFARRGALADVIGARPDRERQMAAMELARSVVVGTMESTRHDRIPLLTETYARINRLAAQAPVFNFDAGLLVMQIGTLLASLAVPRETPHG
ncbi:DNA polymerase III subunit delta' [Altericroceibacterium xinjiangense]|uniref:DNA polymerase III subunit delta' n=1 Tax=Altericroceibacterium xinjiangense TaxID=762261 RepID=UPI000F7E407A|nr:DNA polymerase III subunit delta' [Altericroceibacterium xinjiangense]